MDISKNFWAIFFRCYSFARVGTPTPHNRQWQGGGCTTLGIISIPYPR